MQASPLASLPVTATQHGRCGPALCILGVLSPPNGNQSINYATGLTSCGNDFLCFYPMQVSVNAGKWYYEVQLKKAGTMQIGYVLDKKFTCTTGRSNGVGDDARSWGLDAGRQKLFAANKTLPLTCTKWREQDIVGCAVDLDTNTLIWFVNGTEITRVDMTTSPDFKAGHENLVPAASLSAGEAVFWRFAASQLKHLPTGYSAFQEQPTSAPLASPIKTDEIKGDDPLGDLTLMPALLASYTPTQNTPGVDKIVKDFIVMRGGPCEYGVESKIKGLSAEFVALNAAFEGTMPKVFFKRSFAHTVDDAEKKFNEVRNTVRMINWHLVALLYLFGSEEALKPLFTATAPVARELTTEFRDPVLKFRYIAAIDNRKNGFCECGLFWELERFGNAIAKDRSKMSEKDLEAHMIGLAATVAKLGKWRAWFVSQVSDIPFHTSALETLDEHIERYNKLAAGTQGEMQAKALAKAEKDLADRIESGKRRIKEALDEFERFPERAQEKYKTLNAEIEGWRKAAAAATPTAPASGPALVVGSPTALAWAAEVTAATEKWSAAEDLRLLNRQASEATSSAMSKVNEGLNMIDHHRKDDAIKCLHQAKEMVEKLKLRPGFYGLPLVTAFFDKYETAIDKLEKNIKAWILNRETSDAARELNSSRGTVDDLFNHYRNEEALAKHHKAEELRVALAARTEWADIAVVKAALEEASKKGTAFVKAYKERVLTRQASDRVRECSSAYGTAKDMLFHSRHQDAMVALTKCKELTLALKEDSSLAGLSSITEWLITYEKDVPELEGKIRKTILDREVGNAVREVNSKFTFCEDHFSHYRFEHALKSLSEYRTAGAALESEKRFRGHPQAEECLRAFDKNVPEFETKYNATMLKVIVTPASVLSPAQRAYDEAIRTADGKLGTANDHFDHHRTEMALASLHEYREAVQAIAKREEFAALGGTAYVKKANEELIPQWESKYTAKALAGKCNEAVRGIHGGLTQAKYLFEHHRDEEFLATLRDVEKRMSDAVPPAQDKDNTKKSDTMLIYDMPEMQDALKSAAQAVWTMKQSFDTRCRERLIDEGIRAAKSALNQASDMLYHSRFEEAMTELVRARQAADDLSSALFAVDQDRVTAFLGTFQGEAKSVDEKISATLRLRQLGIAKSAVSSELSNMNQLFGQYRNDEALAALQKAKEANDALEAEFPDTAGDVSANRTAFAAFEVSYRDRVLTKEATEAVSRAKGELSLAEGHLGHSRFEKALECLANARSAYGSVLLNARLKGMQLVTDFEKDFEPKLADLKTRIDATLKAREVDEAIRVLRSSVTEMSDHFSHHRNEAALTSFAKSKSLLESLQRADSGSRKTEADAATAEVSKQITDFQTQFRDRNLATKIKEMTSAALSRMTEAEDALNHSRFEEALEKSHAASALAGQVGADPLLIGSPEVETFLTAFTQRHTALLQRWKDTMRARAESAAKTRATSALSEAKNLFEHHVDEESLSKLQVAREAIAAFAAEFGDKDSFVAEQRKAQQEFETQYSDRVFKAELDRKISKAKGRLASGADSLEHYRYEECLHTLQEADDAVSLLASDERFYNHATVTAFLSEYYAAAIALRSKVKNTLRERAVADVKRRLGSAMSQAEDLYSHCRFEEALTQLHVVHAMMEEEEGAEAKGNAEIATRAAALTEKHQKQHLSREVEALTKRATSQLAQADFFVEHHRFEEAITALHSAREQALALNDAKFDGLASVKEFFDAWPKRVQQTQSTINGRVLAKRAREAVEEVRGPLSEAITALDKHMHEAALEKLQTARDKAAALRQDRDLADVETVKSTLSDFDKQSAAIAARFAKEVYGKELQEILRNIRAQMTQAEQLFARCAPEASLIPFQEARDSAVALTMDARFSGDMSVAEFVQGEWAQRSKAYSNKYAEQVLIDEARKVAADGRQYLTRSILLTDRNVRDKAEEALKEARTVAAPLLAEGSMLASLPVVSAFAGELKQAESLFAAKFLKEEAMGAVKEAQKHLQLASRARSRALDDSNELIAARTAIAPLLGSSVTAPISPAYSTLAEVTAFMREQVLPAFASHGDAGATQLFQSASSAVAGAASGKKKDTIDGILGLRFPQLAMLRKGLLYVPIGTDVHPKFFGALKRSNEAAKSAEKEVKQLIDIVKSLDFEDKGPVGSIPTSIFHHTLAGYPYESVERALVNFAKPLAELQQECKDDDLTAKLTGQYESFSVAWRDSIALLRRFDGLWKNSRLADWMVGFISKIVGDFAGICCSTCPRYYDLSFMPEYNPLDLTYADMKKEDYTIFLFVATLCQRAAERVQRWSKEYGGFPNSEALLKYFAETALASKKEHVHHCIRQVTRAGKDSRKLYTEALRHFPLGLEQAKQAFDYWRNKVYERRKEEMDESVTLPVHTGASTADSDEKAEWYQHEFIPIQPGTVTQFEKRPDMSSMGPQIWTDARRAMVGKIVFSTQAIEDTGDTKNLTDKFNVADAIKGDGIFARAYWGRAIYNYPIAKRRDNGAPVYPPTRADDKHRLELMTVVRVNGKPLIRPDQPHDTWSWFGWSSPQGSEKRGAQETTTDFYGWSQTCRFYVLSSVVHEHLNDEWVRQAARFAYEFTRLPPGEHKVEIDLCFRILSSTDNFNAHIAQGRRYPECDTTISTPLATGSFTLVVPTAPVERRSILPPRAAKLSLPPAELTRLEMEVVETMKKMPDWGARLRKTEHPIYAAVTSDWYEAEHEKVITGQDNYGRYIIVKYTSRFGFDYTVVLCRLTKDGWPKDHVAVFRLAAYGPVGRNPARDIPPMTGIGVAGNFTFEPELLKEFTYPIL